MNSSNETKCLAETLPPALGLVAISLVQASLNGFVSVAVVISRRKLKSNSVYLYVLSMFAANVVFGLFTAYASTCVAYGIERMWTPNSTYRIDQSNPSHRAIQNWRGFRTALTVCMYLVMSANISIVMHGLRESSYFVGPVVMPQTSDAKEQSTSNKRRKAVLLVSLTWLIPLVLTTIVMTAWNCLDKCICFEAYYPIVYSCQADIYRRCNRVFQAMTNDFMIFVVVVWFLLAVVIVGMLFTTVQRYKLAKAAKLQTNTISVLSGNNDELDRKVHSSSNCRKGETFVSNVGSSTDIRQQLERPEEDEANETTYGCWSQVMQLGYTVKAMILISVLFLLCLSPLMIVILIDSSSVEYVLSVHYLLLSFSAVIVYCIACPLILVYYMPGLRQAVSSVFYKCKCCTSTTVTQGKK